MANQMEECFELIQTTTTSAAAAVKITIAIESNKSILGGGR